MKSSHPNIKRIQSYLDSRNSNNDQDSEYDLVYLANLTTYLHKGKQCCSYCRHYLENCSCPEEEGFIK